ncbi:hypothetical protein E2562_030341 [Oryza meyeriana var. granulata]|uniref:Uncharacterized protein n=1 Tax=Oryza meyeriana var. granulata TaxID=110450 RepID=A0A6G1D9C4_9ORYZ|nr:hypothetical protein E2562_030341 [Oryza meyeriana var. granulata]
MRRGDGGRGTTLELTGNARQMGMTMTTVISGVGQRRAEVVRGGRRGGGFRHRGAALATLVRRCQIRILRDGGGTLASVRKRAAAVRRARHRWWRGVAGVEAMTLGSKRRRLPGLLGRRL